MTKGHYNTKQRDELLTYLQGKAGEHVTAGDVCEACLKQGMKIGTATVYRHLEKMVEEGVVKKYNIDSTSAACFEYVDANNIHESGECAHLKCTKCGKLIHLHCDELVSTDKHILEEHSFKVDMTRTVLYGLCEDCQ